MDFLLSSDVQAIPDLIRTFLPAEVPPETVRGALGQRTNGGVLQQDRELWKRFADLGVLGGILPEALGGLGMGLLAGVVAAESWSAPINHLPLFATLAHAVLPLSYCGGVSRVGSLGEGETPLKLCERITSGSIYASGITLSEGEGLSLGSENGMLTLSGELLPFAGGPELDLVVFVIERKKTADICVLELEGNAKEETFAIEPLDTIDLLRSFSVLILDKAPLRIVASITTKAAKELELKQFVLAAAELVGLGAEVVRQTVSFVKTREQFGRPIGSFQAIQHSLADMHLAVEQAQALTRFAAWCADTGDSQFEEAALAAKAFAGDEIPRVIEKGIQAHGGIGFTFESDLHFYLRRAKAQSLLSGDPRELQLMLAESYLGSGLGSD